MHSSRDSSIELQLAIFDPDAISMLYRRAAYFQGCKISRIVKNLLQVGIFVDKFSEISNNNY